MVTSELRTPTQEVVGHGLVGFENSLGGRVAVVPWSANGPVMMNIQRAAQIRNALVWLDPANHFGRAEGGAWLFPQFLTDGGTWRGVVWNGSDDAVDRFRVHTPAGMPRPSRVVQVDGRGGMFEGAFTGPEVVPERPVAAWGFVVLI